MIGALYAIFGSLIIGTIIFGGGQTFMPVFGSLWKLMGLDGQTIENIYTVVNATPGVIGTQFALITGYLAAMGQWWGFLLMIATYLVFFIPSVVLIWYGYRLLLKASKHKYLLHLVMWLQPVIIGIILSLAMQLLLATAFPSIIFNQIDNYFGLDFESPRASFFSNWRFYVAIFYTIFAICETFYLSHYKNVNFAVLIIAHIILGMVIFQPWLN